ncbi:hypothetical protein D3C80_2036280 [compost metagenome]
MELVLCATKYSSEPNGYKEVIDSGGGGFIGSTYGLALVFAGGSVVASHLAQKMVSIMQTFGT